MPKEQQGLSDVVRSENYLDSLRAARDEIAADLQVCESMRDKAALYLRLSDVLAKIEDVKPQESKGDAVDEIAARRAARRAGPGAGSSRAERSG